MSGMLPLGLHRAQSGADIRDEMIRTGVLQPLFDSSLRQATGTLEARGSAGGWSLGVRSGRVVHVEGRPDLLADVGITDGAGDLTKDLGAAIARGVDMNRAFQAAEDGLGRALVALAGAADGSLRFDGTDVPPPGSFPLPTPVLRLLARAFTAQTREPDVSDEARSSRLIWRGPGEVKGMNPVEERIHQLAQKGAPVGKLIDAIGRNNPARGRQAAATIELMLATGLIALRAPARREAVRQTRTEQDSDRRVQALRQKIARRKQEVSSSPHHHKSPEAVDAAESRAASKAARPQSDKATLAAALAGMEGKEPLELLGLQEALFIDASGLTMAFRDSGARYHPDRFAGASAEVQELAGQAFSVINDAFEHLRDPAVLDHTNKMLDARSRGEYYVNEISANKAKVFFRKAESALQRRNTKLACELATKAVEMDPRQLDYRVLLVSTQVFSRAIDPEQALVTLAQLEAKTPKEEILVYFATGRLLKFVDREEDAVKYFRRVLRIEPAHADAKREVWLHEKRSAGGEDNNNTAMRIASFFGRRS